MAVQKIGYAGKSRGDLWTATDANEVKEVVNNNADILSGHDTSLQTLNDTVDDMAKSVSQHSQTIKELSNGSIRQVFLSQSEYDTMAANNQIEDEVLYNIYE